VHDATTTTKSFVGEAMWKKVQGATTTLYLPSMRIEGAGLVRKSYGTFAERDTDGTLKFYHGDHLGSSTLVTNASGAVVHRQAYKPYGEDLVAAAPGNFTPKYQFNFKEKEADGTGFYDYGARLYNPATGRWLSADSSDVDGFNRYAYAKNNPLFYKDSTGHWNEPWYVTAALYLVAGPMAPTVQAAIHPVATYNALGEAAATVMFAPFAAPGPNGQAGLVSYKNVSTLTIVKSGVVYATIAAGPSIGTAIEGSLAEGRAVAAHNARVLTSREYQNALGNESYGGNAGTSGNKSLAAVNVQLDAQGRIVAVGNDVTPAEAATARAAIRHSMEINHDPLSVTAGFHDVVAGEGASASHVYALGQVGARTFPETTTVIAPRPEVPVISSDVEGTIH